MSQSLKFSEHHVIAQLYKLLFVIKQYALGVFMRYFLAITVLLFCHLSEATELAYVQTDNPRETMETFMSAMNDYRDGVLHNDRSKRARIYDAIRCFAEKDSALIASQREKELSAIFLKEAIDRVIVINPQLIPEQTDIPRWRLKNTEVVLMPIDSGDRKGEWLFTESTWKRAQLFYDRVKHMPYLAGSGHGALYEQPWMEEYLPDWSKRETLFLKNWQWLGIFLGLFFGLLLRFIVFITIGLIKNFKFTSRLSWKKHLLSELEKPISLLASAFFWYGLMFYLKLEGMAFSLVNSCIQIVFGISITWAIFKSVTVFCFYLKQRAEKTESPLDDQLIPFIEKTLKLIVILMGILVVLQNMGVNVFSLLAGLGLGGLAFALAAKDTAANLFGSIMILVDRPFKVGDWINIGTVEGNIEEIGFRSTRIRTFYNSLVTVPNSTMANVQIDNLGLRQYRRTRVHLDVAYDTKPDQMKQFVAGIREIILNNDLTRKDLFHVYFDEYGSSSLKVLLSFFIITTETSIELQTRQGIYLEIYDLAQKLEIEFAYPTQTLFVKNLEDQTTNEKSGF